MRYERPPDDFAALTELVRDPASTVQVSICARDSYSSDPFLILPVPIAVPPLSTRVADLPRIIEEYGEEAIAALGAPPGIFTAADATWVIQHHASTLSEIEKATLRLVALHMSESLNSAARLLGMKGVSLRKWMGRRKMPT